MAYRSTGRTNAEFIQNMKREGLIKTPEIERAFLAVDRADFLPPNARLSGAEYQDSPLHSGNFHLSAQHIYAWSLDELELARGMSFLNVGSGTGYLSYVVAVLTGDVRVDGIEHCRELVEFARSRQTQVPYLYDFHNVRFYCGDAFLMGESWKGLYDRIYVGGGLRGNEALTFFSEMLNPRGGILVAPRDDEFVKVRRDGPADFTIKVITNVRFAPLSEASDTKKMTSGRIQLGTRIFTDDGVWDRGGDVEQKADQDDQDQDALESERRLMSYSANAGVFTAHRF